MSESQADARAWDPLTGDGARHEGSDVGGVSGRVSRVPLLLPLHQSINSREESANRQSVKCRAKLSLDRL